MSNDTFQWSDDLVKEYLKTRIEDTFMSIEHFKKSKTTKKEWEIVECYVENHGPHKFVPDGIVGREGCIESKCKIYSVRRLSDNEVFTVGEKTGDEEVIERFDLKNGIMYYWDNRTWHYFSQAKKVKEQPKKERIEVKDVGIESMLIKFEGRRLSVEKIEQVKTAIEKVLNDEA